MMVLCTKYDDNLIFDLHKFSKSQNNIKKAFVGSIFQKLKQFWLLNTEAKADLKCMLNIYNI